MASQPNQGQPPSTINPLRDVVIVGGSISATSAATATAVAPTYAEGSVQPLSQDLSGQLRISGTINASSAAQATTADPTYTNNTSNPFSQTLAGYLRVSAKQSGSWSVGIDQTTPGVTNLVNVSNLPNVVDTNAGAAGVSTLRFVLASGGASQAVTGTFFQATQPVSAVSLPLPTGASTETTLAAVNTKLGGTLAVSGTFWQATQPVSGTIAATQSGTWNIGTVTTITGISTAFGAVASAVPSSAGLSGLQAATALPSASTAGNLVAALADKFGRQITRGAPRDLLTTAALSTTGTSGTLLAAQSVGTFADMYRLVIANSSAAAVLVTISDGTNSYGYEVPANGTVGFSGAAADATVAAAAATAWTYTVASGTTTIYIHAQFVLNK